MEGQDGPQYEEVTLADLVRTVHRRRLVLLAVFMAALLVGVAVTVFTPREYEARATVIPLENPDIIGNWLDSRSGADHVVDTMGDRLLSVLFEDRWNAGTRTWDGSPPSDVQAANALLGLVDVSSASTSAQGERLITLRVRMEDPTIARDVANTYLDGLVTLRPLFENITRQEAFDRYYDGSNEQEANQRAEVTAKQKDYWLVLDRAVEPQSPASPNVQLNIALSVVLGLMLGIFAVFLVEWSSRFRADLRRPSLPPVQQEAREPTVAEEPRRGRYRYRGR